MKKLLIIILTFISTVCNSQTGITVTNLRKTNIDVHFELGSYTLTVNAMQIIDSLIQSNIVSKRRHVRVVGYADIIGQEKDNKILSEKRAYAVATFLKKKGIDNSHIEIVIGNGEINRPEKIGGYPDDRKVSLIPGDVVEPDSKPTDTSKLLATIYFQFRTALIDKKNMPALEELCNRLKTDKKIKVRLEGYVCCYNLTLEKPEDPGEYDTPTEYHKRLVDELTIDRAKTIYSYLIRNGIDSARVIYKGMTGANPLILDGKKVCNLQRQRVEAVIIAN